MTYGEIWERGMARLEEMGRANDLDLACETRSSTSLNRKYLDSIAIEMRLLKAVVADTTTQLFGTQLQSPVIGAPLGFGRVLGQLAEHGPQYGTGYLEPIAAGLADAGSMMGVGVAPAEQLQSVLDVGAPTYVIVKPYRERERILSKIRDAEARGVVAVGIDIDAGYGVRTRYEPVGETYNAPLSPAELAEVRASTKLPFILKGILSVSDARAAVDTGVDTIVVCNHGGEIIDYAVPPLKVLPDIVEALADSKITILVGSGLQTGTDVLKALALGADAVMLGTPLIVGLAAAGADGVAALVRGLSDELRRNLSIVGAATPSDVDRSILHFPFLGGS